LSRGKETGENKKIRQIAESHGILRAKVLRMTIKRELKAE